MNFANRPRKGIPINRLLVLRGGLLLSLSLIITACGSSLVSPSVPPATLTVPTATVFSPTLPAPTPTLAPTRAPTPTPKPTPTPVARFTEDQMAAVCLSPGVPIPEAAAYAGDLHPLVVVFQQGGDPTGWDLSKYLPYDINTQYYSDLWPSPIQLVVCVGQSQVRVDSCGSYKRDEDGVVGQVIRYKQANTVRVIIAATGQVLTSKTFYGTLPDCSPSIVPWSDGPPWSIWGDSAPDDSINAYAVAASTQKG